MADMHFFRVRLIAACAVLSGVHAATIKNDDHLIFYNGRWDKSPGTWWASSGFKINVEHLSSLILNLGNHTTAPLASVGVSLDYEPFYTVNVSAGVNDIPLTNAMLKKRAEPKDSVVRINVEGWQDNRINLESIELNEGAALLPYEHSKLAFQFIGDSLSAGQYCPMGVDQAWTFLTGENFKAEHNINAQPGATLSDILSYGNVHGVSYQFFKTEDTGYYDTTDHNYTTPWDFKRDVPPTHVVIHIGANDASQNVTAPAFQQVYSSFLTKLRVLYPHQPIFVFTPWGWPSADGSVSYYYEGDVYPGIVEQRHALGDKEVFLVNTTGWVGWEDVFPANQHPTPAGHQKIAGLFAQWLEGWGLKPQTQWATPL